MNKSHKSIPSCFFGPFSALFNNALPRSSYPAESIVHMLEYLLINYDPYPRGYTLKSHQRTMVLYRVSYFFHIELDEPSFLLFLFLAQQLRFEILGASFLNNGLGLVELILPFF